MALPLHRIYYDKEPPTEGLKAALKIVTLQANSWEWARKTFGTHRQRRTRIQPKHSRINSRSKLSAIKRRLRALTSPTPIIFSTSAKPPSLASVDPTKIKVPTLVLYAPNDLIFYEPIAEDTIQKIAAAGDSGRERGVARTERPSQWNCTDRAGSGQDQGIPRRVDQNRASTERDRSLVR